MARPVISQPEARRLKRENTMLRKRLSDYRRIVCRYSAALRKVGK